MNAELHPISEDRLSPLYLLHLNLSRIDDIEAVMVVVKRKDGTVEADWSNMMTSDLCFMLKILDLGIQEEL